MSKAAAPQPLTTMVPVTTMEEMPLPNETERTALIASLEKSEAEVAAGRGRAHDPQTFAADMQALRTAAKRSRNA